MRDVSSNSPAGFGVEGFVALLKEHDVSLRNLAWRLLGSRDRMDDALQEAYVKAFHNRSQLRCESDAPAWLHRIVRNECLNELRRGNRRPQPVDIHDGSHEFASRAALIESSFADVDAVRRGLASLPADLRAVLVLVEVEGLDYSTVAEELGIATGTVGSRLSRARLTMRRMIGDQQ